MSDSRPNEEGRVYERVRAYVIAGSLIVLLLVLSLLFS